ELLAVGALDPDRVVALDRGERRVVQLGQVRAAREDRLGTRRGLGHVRTADAVEERGLAPVVGVALDLEAAARRPRHDPEAARADALLVLLARRAGRHDVGVVLPEWLQDERVWALELESQREVAL